MWGRVRYAVYSLCGVLLTGVLLEKGIKFPPSPPALDNHPGLSDTSGRHFITLVAPAAALGLVALAALLWTFGVRSLATCSIHHTKAAVMIFFSYLYLFFLLYL